MILRFIMNSTNPFLFLLALIICFIPRIKAQASQVNCTGPTCAPNTTYHTNLIHLLSTLSSNANHSDGFYNKTFVGQNNNTVYGLLLCRGDATVLACQTCVSDATKDIIMRCPNTTQAIGWYDKCMLRYSDSNFFSIQEDGLTQTLYNSANTTNRDRFMRLVIDTMKKVASDAAYGGGNYGRRKFATKEVNYSSFETLYTLAQCTSDLSGDECYNCLRRPIGEYPTCCFGRVGAIARAYSCNVRYELYPFYGVVSLLPPNNHPPAKAEVTSNVYAGTIIIAVSVSFVSIIMFFCCGCYYWKSKMSNSYKAIMKKNFGSEGAKLESLQFNLATIQTATDKFY